MKRPRALLVGGFITGGAILRIVGLPDFDIPEILRAINAKGGSSRAPAIKKPSFLERSRREPRVPV
jgi:hypothetical protein